jgi:pre-mRNA-processing factor 40
MNGFAPGAPPAVWQETKADDGRLYYYNPHTRVTRWDKPAEMMTESEVRFPPHSDALRA